MKILSLRPYIGEIWLARDKSEFRRLYTQLWPSLPIPTLVAGRTDAGYVGKIKKSYVALVWANNQISLAHELSHVIFDVFKEVGIDSRDSQGEAFCYMLSQLLLDAKNNENES